MNQEVAMRVIKVIAKTQKIPESSIELNQKIQDICPHSLNLVDLLFEIEDEFDISIADENAQKLETVQDIVTGIEKLLEKTVDKV